MASIAKTKRPRQATVWKGGSALCQVCRNLMDSNQARKRSRYSMVFLLVETVDSRNKMSMTFTSFPCWFSSTLYHLAAYKFLCNLRGNVWQIFTETCQNEPGTIPIMSCEPRQKTGRKKTQKVTKTKCVPLVSRFVANVFVFRMCKGATRSKRKVPYLFA